MFEIVNGKQLKLRISSPLKAAISQKLYLFIKEDRTIVWIAQ